MGFSVQAECARAWVDILDDCGIEGTIDPARQEFLVKVICESDEYDLAFSQGALRRFQEVVERLLKDAKLGAELNGSAQVAGVQSVRPEE